MVKLILRSLQSRAFNSVLSVMLTALGVMLAVLIILFTAHVEERLGRNAQGIDFIIGAKGSPIQLILSSIYHVDIPTGNISYDVVKEYTNHPQIKSAVPLALGDTYKRFRIVGTTKGYISLYNGKIKNGVIWRAPYQAVVGADTGLSVGQKFVGAHGLHQGGDHHEEHPYIVTGVLARSGTVLDRLILTSVDSVLRVHGQTTDIDHDIDNEHEHEHEHHEDHDEHNVSHRPDDDLAKAEITALLIKTRSPVAIMNLPRHINRNTHLQAAIPSYEMARLTTVLGLGSKTIFASSAILVVIAGLSIFSGITSSLENRNYDLAVMRVLGFTPARIFGLILGEGMFLIISGLLIGVILGHITFYVLVYLVQPLKEYGASLWGFDYREALLTLFILCLGICASLIPAIKAARLDVSEQISKAS